MTTAELIPKILEHGEDYMVESETQVITGTTPRRKHKKKRIQKKWIKKYGIKPIIETKKCKQIEVTVDLIIEFCAKYKYPLPDEIIDKFECSKDTKNNIINGE